MKGPVSHTTYMGHMNDVHGIIMRHFTFFEAVLILGWFTHPEAANIKLCGHHWQSVETLLGCLLNIISIWPVIF